MISSEVEVRRGFKKDVVFGGKTYSALKLSTESPDLAEAWSFRKSLDQEKRRLMDLHPKLKLRISAQGGKTFGQEMDQRMVEWGEEMIQAEGYEKQLRESKPEVFIDENRQKENLQLVEDLAVELRRIRKGSRGYTDIEGESLRVYSSVYGIRFFRSKTGVKSADLGMHNADNHYIVKFDEKGDPIELMWVDLKSQRQDFGGKSDHYISKYCVGIPFCLLALDRNKNFLEMVKDDLGSFRSKTEQK